MAVLQTPQRRRRGVAHEAIGIVRGGVGNDGARRHVADLGERPNRRLANGRVVLVRLVGERGQTAAPSLKIGRYMAMTRPPTSTPRIAMMSGSSKLLIASTAASTSAS